MAAKPKRKKSRKRLIIPAYLLAVIILIVLIYLLPTVAGSFSKTMTVEYGSLSNSHDVSCYIIKNETVYYAAEDGAAGYYFNEGTCVRAGTELITMDYSAEGGSANDYKIFNRNAHTAENPAAAYSDSNGRMSAVEASLRDMYAGASDERKAAEINRYIELITGFEEDGLADNVFSEENESDLPDTSFGITGVTAAQSSGVLSYILDGYESLLSPYTIPVLDSQKMSKISFDEQNVCTGKACKGEPLFKIVDNDKWYAVTWMDITSLGSFEEGKKVRLTLPKGDVEGKISKMYDNGNEIMIVMEFDCYYEDLASLRKIDTKLYTSTASGLIVNRSFIASREGTPGVYVLDVTGETTFVPVKILDSDSENSIVASGFFYKDGERYETVNVYDEIKIVEEKLDSGDDEQNSDQESA